MKSTGDPMDESEREQASLALMRVLDEPDPADLESLESYAGRLLPALRRAVAAGATPEDLAFSLTAKTIVFVANMREGQQPWPSVVLSTNPWSWSAVLATTCREFGEDEMACLLERNPAGYLKRMRRIRQAQSGSPSLSPWLGGDGSP